MSVQPLLGLRAACILVVLVVAVIWIPAASAFFPELPPTIHARAEADAPNGYAPASIPCPTPRPAVRAATDISPEERAWLDLREKNTVSALRTVLTRADIAGLDIDSYMDMFANDTNLAPRVGIALSGGGYRALLNGAGALAAFDDRSSNSTGQGQLGGLLQAATYLSGLSGGSWTVGSLYTQNFTTVESIVEATSGFLSSLWRLDESIFEGPQSISVSRYYRELHDSVKAKVDAGFNKTITDYWGRALSYQLVNATDGGPAYTFSSIANDVEFANARAPMPIIVSIERPPGTLLIPENSVIFEFNPWEMGSYDLDVSAFAPLKYIGTDLRNEPTDNECVGGFDNVGFVMGTSSSLFNQAFLQIQTSSDAPGFLVRALNETLEQVGENNRDIATWPNPFYQYNPESNPSSDSTILTLVDGGEDLQNIPLNPLTLTARRVDVILAVDSSADTSTHWPNGTSLVATYRRSASGNSGNNSAFPPVPNTNTFVNLGLNYRPTFFGCSGNDSNNDNTGPLIVYLPNAPYTSNSNFSTFDMEYTTEERNDIVQNGYNVVTMGNGTVDPTWPACLGCAILQRSFGRTNTSPPPACNECFDRYCWNGTVDDSDPGIYEPAMVIPSASGGRRTIASASITLVIVYVILFLVS